MDIQAHVAKHLPVVCIDPETGLLISDHYVGINPISVNRTFINKSQEAIAKIGLYLLGGSLYWTNNKPVLLDHVSSLCLISYQGQAYAVDFISYLELNEETLSTLTGLEFIKTLSQEDIDKLLSRIDRMRKAEASSDKVYY